MALSLNPVSNIERNLLFDNAIGNIDNLDLELPDWIPDERREAVQALGSSLPDVCNENNNESKLEKCSRILMYNIYYLRLR
jgi:hypothetical protein